MTQEELLEYLKKDEFDIAPEMQKVVNSVMDLYQKGIETGLAIGAQITMNKAITYFRPYIRFERSEEETNQVMEYFEKALQE